MLRKDYHFRPYWNASRSQVLLPGGSFAKLHSVVDGKPGYSPAQLQEALASAKSARVEAIRQRTLTSPSGKAVIALFSRIGTFCPTGEVLDSLKGHQAKLQDVEFLILFPKDFTSNDVQNFKSNLKVSIPVALADPELANVWESFHSDTESCRSMAP